MNKFGDVKTSILTYTVIKKIIIYYLIKVTYQKDSTSEQEIIILKYVLNIGSYKILSYNLDIGKTNLNIYQVFHSFQEKKKRK